MISFFYQDEEYSDDLTNAISKICLQIFQDYNKNLNYSNYILVSNEELLEINRTHLHHDYYTDIITFNYSDIVNGVEAEMYISINNVADNSVLFSVAPQLELVRVCIHGSLHVCGFDDVTDSDKSEMQSLENEYIKLLDYDMFHVEHSIFKK
ncbi:MAG: rRNA maturation RNase YbeY [Bacteroidota bacterium]|nr:rRNA maturation RNase YbeY [Bacteroidota bacterium]